MNAMFASQPSEGTGGLSDDQIVAVAKQVGAEGAADCITSGTHKKYAAQQAAAHEIRGTPTIEIDGERLENTEIAARFATIFN